MGHDCIEIVLFITSSASNHEMFFLDPDYGAENFQSGNPVLAPKCIKRNRKKMFKATFPFLFLKIYQKMAMEATY